MDNVCENCRESRPTDCGTIRCRFLGMLPFSPSAFGCTKFQPKGPFFTEMFFGGDVRFGVFHKGNPDSCLAAYPEAAPAERLAKTLNVIWHADMIAVGES